MALCSGGGFRSLKPGRKSHKPNMILPGLEDILVASLRFPKWTRGTGKGVCGLGQLFLGMVGKPGMFLAVLVLSS